MGVHSCARCHDDLVRTTGGLEQPGATPPLPGSIWIVAWTSLVGQALLVFRQGVRLDDEVSLVLSVVLGGLLVGYVSAGVVRARSIRLGVAWVVLALSGVGDLLGVVTLDGLGQAALAGLSLATTLVALAALARFHRTDWYAWQRTRPSTHEGVAIGPLVAIGVLVGVLGGLAAPVDDGIDVRISVAER